MIKPFYCHFSTTWLIVCISLSTTHETKNLNQKKKKESKVFGQLPCCSLVCVTSVTSKISCSLPKTSCVLYSCCCYQKLSACLQHKTYGLVINFWLYSIVCCTFKRFFGVFRIVMYDGLAGWWVAGLVVRWPICNKDTKQNFVKEMKT